MASSPRDAAAAGPAPPRALSPSRSVRDAERPPLTWAETFSVFALCVALSGGYVLAFSAVVGYGEETYRVLRGDQLEVPLALCGVCILFALYLLDFGYWRSPTAVACSRLFVALASLLLVAALAMSAHTFAQAPPTLYTIAVPLTLMATQRAFFADRSVASFLSTLAHALWVCSFLIAVVFAFVVITREAYWTESLKLEYQRSIECDPNHDCLASYLMWFTPVVASVVALVFGTLCHLLARSRRESSKIGVDPRVRAFALVMCAVSMGLWIVVQVAGTARELAAVVMTSSMVSFLVAAVMLGGTIGWSRIADDLVAVPLFASLRKAVTEWGVDVIKAVLLSSPVVLVLGAYVLVSALNQLVRRVNPHGKPFESVEERNSPVTAALAEQMREARRWKWTKILVYAHYWIIAVVSLVVLAGTFTVVFLSWVRVQLYGADLGTIYAMFYVVGIAMFLNPFIPGLPVYLTGGILLTGPRFQDAFGGDARYPGSYAAALACAIAFCFFLKLSAAFMQQKLIGERLGRRVWVRSLVGVNSVTMRAIRKILLAPGLDFAKVCVLVGGPDWPVSVTAGILKCDVAQMLIGTTPVFFLIAPSVAAGAFMLKIGGAASGDSACPPPSSPPPPSPPPSIAGPRLAPESPNPWESISQVMSVVTAFVQSAGLLAGMYYIEKTSAAHRRELEEEPPDREVLAIDERKRRRAEVRAAVTEWTTLPFGARATLAASTSLIVVSYWGILYAPSALPPETIVKDYVLTDCVSQKLDGKAWTVVTRAGWVLLGMFAAACVGLWGFGRWAEARMDEALKEGAKADEGERGEAPKEGRG